MSSCISYVNHASSYTEGIPAHLQRLMISSYCQRESLVVRFQQLEILGMPHLPTLLEIVETHKPDDVVLFSVYSLPKDEPLRTPILDAALAEGITLHFANEDLTIRNSDERQTVEQVLTFCS